MSKNQIAIIFMTGILTLSGIVSCATSTQQATRPVSNSPQNSTNSQVVSSHSTDKTAPTSSSNSSSTGSPMAQAVDVTEMTAKIEKAEKNYKAQPKDEKAKETLAIAYFERATALTGAAQYRAALGDYRKGLKLNPNDEAAKAMHDQIISIFKSIGREPPKEGEEPPPLPVNK